MNLKLLSMLLLALIGAVRAVPISVERLSCAQSCSIDPRFVDYELGKTYVYAYDSQTALSLIRADAEPIGLSARVEISSDSPCELALRLVDVRLNGTARPTELERQLESQSIVFGYDDGTVTGVCPSPEDSQWAITVKKSIISALQMSAKSTDTESVVTETDILGECETVYSPNMGPFGNYIAVRKSKSLADCKQSRQSLISAFGLNRLIRNNHNIAKSRVNCLQVIENNIVTDVKCDESLALLPSMMAAPGKPTVTSRLNLRFQRIESRLVTTGDIQYIPQPLLMMDRQNGDNSPADNSRILELLSDLCRDLQRNMFTAQSTHAFRELVSALRRERNVDSLKELISAGEFCSTEKLMDLFLDASAAAANQTVGVDNGRTRALHMSSLFGLFSKPTDEKITALVPLFQNLEISNRVILIHSTLVHNYCEDVESCDQIPAVSQIVDALLKRFRRVTTAIDQISTVKAIADIRVRTHEMAIDLLMSLATNKAVEDEIRVAAMAALANAFDDDITGRLLRVFLDSAEPVEVRIAAYKSIVTAGYVTGEQFNQINEQSDSNVANYVRSHVRNMLSRDSGALPADAPLFAEPDTGYLTSRNIEFVHSGVAVNVDIIYPRSLQFPRAITVRASVPVFGKELQLIEVEARQRGLDSYLRGVIGRSAGNLPAMYRELIELFAQPNAIESDDSRYAQLFLKIDGKNVLAMDTRSASAGFSSSSGQSLTEIVEQIARALSASKSLDRAFGAVLLDSRLQIPLMSGMPLVVDLYAGLLTAVKANFDYGADRVKAKLQPSMGLEFSASMFLNAVNARPGLVAKSRLFSSPLVDAMAEVRDNRLFNGQINVPHTRQTLIRVETETETIDNYGTTNRNQVRQSKQSKSCSQMSKAFGISLCSENSRTDRSSHYELSLIKLDKSMKSFTLSVEAPPNYADDYKAWKVTVNTPNSDVDRQVSAELQLSNPSDGQKSVSLRMQSPWKEMSASAAVLSDESQSSVSVDLTSDGQSQVRLDFGLGVESKSGAKEYRPAVKLQAWGRKSQISLDGFVLVAPDSDDSTDENEINNDVDYYSGARFKRSPEDHEHNHDAEHSHNALDADSKVVTDLNLKIFALDANVKARVNRPKKRVDLVVEYNLENLSKETVQLSLNGEHSHSEELHFKSLGVELVSSQFPEYNFQVQAGKRYEKDAETKTKRIRDVDLLVQWGEDFAERVHLNRSYNRVDGGDHDRAVDIRWHIEATPLKIHYDLQLNGYRDVLEAEKQRLYNIEINGKDLSRSENNEFRGLIKLKRQELADGQRIVNGTVNLSGPLIEAVPQYSKFREIDIDADWVRRQSLHVHVRRPGRETHVQFTRQKPDWRSGAYTLDVTYTDDNAAPVNLIAAQVNYNVTDKGYSDKIEINYICNGTAERLLSKRKFLFDLNEGSSRINLTVLSKLNITQRPEYNRKFYYRLESEKRKFGVDELLFAWGAGLENKINLKRDVRMTRTDNQVNLTESASVVITPWDYDYEVSEVVGVDIGDNGLRSLGFTMSVTDRTGRHPELNSNGDLQLTRVVNGDVVDGQLNASLVYRGREMAFRETYKHVYWSQRQVKMYVQWDKGQYADIEYDAKLSEKQLKKGEQQRDLDLVIKYKRWNQDEPREIRGTINRYILTDRRQTRFNFESSSGKSLKGTITRKGSIHAKKEFLLSYDVSLQNPGILELKIASKKRVVGRNQASSELSVDYKCHDKAAQSLKANTRANLVLSHQLVNATFYSELRSSEFPAYNYLIDEQVIYKLYQRYLQSEFTVAWGADLEANRIRLYQENQDQPIKDGFKSGAGLLTIEAKPFGVEWEFKGTTNQTRSKEHLLTSYRSEYVGTNVVSGNRAVNSLVDYRNENGSRKLDVLLSAVSQSRQWSRVANVSVATGGAGVLFERILVDYSYQNNRTNRYVDIDVAVNNDHLSLVSVKSHRFEAEFKELSHDDATGELSGRIELLGKKRLPYRHVANVQINARNRTFKAQAETERVITPTPAAEGDLTAAVYSQLLFKHKIDYAYRKRARLEVDAEPYKSDTEIVYENFPQVTLRSATTNAGANVLNVNASLADGLKFEVNALTPDVRLVFDLDPRNRKVNFDVQNP